MAAGNIRTGQRNPQVNMLRHSNLERFYFIFSYFCVMVVTFGDRHIRTIDKQASLSSLLLCAHSSPSHLRVECRGVQS